VGKGQRWKMCKKKKTLGGHRVRRVIKAQRLGGVEQIGRGWEVVGRRGKKGSFRGKVVPRQGEK